MNIIVTYTTVKGVDTHNPRQLAFSSKGLLAPVE